MKTIKAIIQSFSEAERKEFVVYLGRKNRRGDTRNIQLFQLIANNFKGRIDEKVYGKPARNAYHALSRRLQESLIDFIASKGFSEETSEEMDILKLLLAALIFFERKLYPVGAKTLKKAEKKALSLDVYTLLTEIYHTKIQYAHAIESWSLDKIIAATKQNERNVQRELQLNMAYARIKSQLKNTSGHFVNQIISQTFSEFDIEINTGLTFKSLFQLLNITASAAALQSDYYPVSPYMMSLYTIVSEKEKQASIKDKHLFYHIEILNLMAITSFRNKDFSTSSDFVEKMELEMRKQQRAYYNRFVEKWTVLKALNKNYTGSSEDAIQILTNYEGDSLDIQLTLIMCYFQQNEFKKAYAVFRQLQHSDRWYERRAGWLWVLKKSIIEILLLMELDRLDLVVSRLESFNKRFSKRLKLTGEDRVLQFMKLVRYYYDHPEEVTSKVFEDKVERSFEWVGKEREDIFVMSFYAWLKSKMEKTPLYETTLDLAK